MTSYTIILLPFYLKLSPSANSSSNIATRKDSHDRQVENEAKIKEEQILAQPINNVEGASLTFHRKEEVDSTN